MIHNVVRAKAISAIFRLQEFTVQQLAEASGLGPSQLYPILKDCKDKSLLATESSSTAERKAHRPVLLYKVTPGAEGQSIDELLPLVPTFKEDGKQAEIESVYQMTSDLDLRSSMADELRPLISVSEEEVRTRAEWDSFRSTLNKASSLLDDVELQLGYLDDALSVQPDIDRFSLIEKKMAETQEELETATYESGVRLSDLGKTEVGPNAPREEPWYSLKVTWVRFRNYAKRVADLKEASAAAQADLAAQKEYATALSSLILSKVNPETIERRLGDLYKKADSPSVREIFATTLENLRETLLTVAGGEAVGASWMVVHSLMASAIRYCSDAKLPLKMGMYLLQQKHDDRCLIYNVANLRVLAGEESEEAYLLWSRWAEGFLKSGYLWQASETKGKYRTPYSYVALMSLPLAALDASVFSELKEKLGERATFSVASHSPLTARGFHPYVAEPTLCDPLSYPQEIRVSESLGSQVGRLYVYGSLEKRVKNVPGVPAVRLAGGLVMSGVASTKAWEIAHNLQTEQALLVLHSFDERPVGVTHVDDAVRDLQRRSGGLLLGSMQAKNSDAAPVVLRR